jgi:transcriptional regulator with XRE-family HTH domain
MEQSSDKTEKSALPVVAIDGVKIKSIREAKQLTQLYVASVVGVTTDTISRWENNRYPTIRRDNAEKLATALEVDPAEILKREEGGEESDDALSPPEQKSHRRFLVPVITLAVILVAAAVLLSRQMFVIPTAERNLPAFGAPGEIIPVQIKIDRKDAGTEGFIVKEKLPAGWRFINSLPPAAGKAYAEEVKWLITAGTGSVAISYTVQIPPMAGLKTSALFTGEVVVNVDKISRRKSCSGDSMVTVDAVHWADENGDGRIDDDEIMPAFYRTEEMKGLGLDWDTVEAIWNGKGYRWDVQKKLFEIIR